MDDVRGLHDHLNVATSFGRRGFEVLLPQQLSQLGIDGVQGVGVGQEDQIFEPLAGDEVRIEQGLAERRGFRGLFAELEFPEKLEIFGNCFGANLGFGFLPATVGRVRIGCGPETALGPLRMGEAGNQECAREAKGPCN
jgi:hypothetical protein